MLVVFHVNISSNFEKTFFTIQIPVIHYSKQQDVGFTLYCNSNCICEKWYRNIV